MQFKQGTKVFASSGQEIGTIDRVVLDPSTNEVTHLVVRKGFLFAEDKVIPIDLVQLGTENKVILGNDSGDPQSLPRFEETHYIPLEEVSADKDYPSDYAPPLYWYPPVGRTTGGYPGYSYAFPIAPFLVETEKNIPDGAIALKEGAKVLSSEGKHVGSVEQVFTDTRTDRVTHFLVSQGLFVKAKKLVPLAWVVQVNEDQVQLKVKAEILEKLPNYEGQASAGA